MEVAIEVGGLGGDRGVGGVVHVCEDAGMHVCV